MHILMTGAAGFIGSHLARIVLNEGHTITAVFDSQTKAQRISDIFPRVDPLFGDVRYIAGYGASLRRNRRSRWVGSWPAAA